MEIGERYIFISFSFLNRKYLNVQEFLKSLHVSIKPVQNFDSCQIRTVNRYTFRVCYSILKILSFPYPVVCLLFYSDFFAFLFFTSTSDEQGPVDGNGCSISDVRGRRGTYVFLPGPCHSLARCFPTTGRRTDKGLWETPCQQIYSKHRYLHDSE